MDIIDMTNFRVPGASRIRRHIQNQQPPSQLNEITENIDQQSANDSFTLAKRPKSAILFN